ncbi:GNAT family N-acetyltransferase [Nocardioides panacisoli]|uniref:N-acetyltransferase domain-containing protein n=1 Tax=Nocardioides panacisoli TaxID=627624 RepID=A0ABP7ITM7_9ACTN
MTSTILSTIAERARGLAELGDDPSTSAPYWWFATVADGGDLVGVAMRTAPFEPYPLYLLAMPDDAAAALADGVLDRGEEVGGVNGLRPAADVCAERVAERTGSTVLVAMHTRLFELGELVAPAPVPGRLRSTRPDEVDLAHDWLVRFFGDADEQAGRERGAGHAETASVADIERKIREGTLWFWVGADDVPVCMVGANPPAFGVTRIAPVYTPPEHRGRGYASAATHDVSRLLRDSGARVTLFTDQANPTSNRIYQALGYAPVADTVDLRLAQPPLTGGASSP